MDAAADVYQQAGQPEIEHRDRDGTGKLYEWHWGDSRKLLRRREWLPIPTRGRCCCCCVLQREAHPGDPIDDVIQPVVGRSNHDKPVRRGWHGLMAHRIHALCKLTSVEEAVVSLDQHPTDQQISTRD